MRLSGVKIHFRDFYGITLPFALILTFIFSSLVGVSYLFVSVNLNQMQSSLWAAQAIATAEGINERVKARLNTKQKIQVSREQETRLKSLGEEELEEEEDLEEEALEEEFDEETEEFDEYYADEVLKISRYITFKEPPETPQVEEDTPGVEPIPDVTIQPEANVEKIGDIEIPQGTILTKGIMLVVYKDDKLDLNLKDIEEAKKQFRDKLPVPVIKALVPNFSEPNKRASFVVNGENLSNKTPTFSNKDIFIEDIKGGPLIQFLISEDVKPGLTRFYIDTAQAEFYVVPTYDGSPKPVIYEIKNNEANQLLEVKAGQSRLLVMIYGYDLNLNKSLPVVIPDVAGIVPQVKDVSQNGKEITLLLSLNKKVEPGVHSLFVVTEGGISNTWLFNVLPRDETQIAITTHVATYSTSLTLLDINVVQGLLPLIDEDETSKKEKALQKKAKIETKKKEAEELGLDIDEEEEVTETEKLSPFANLDLETSWLLETTAKVGRVTKTVSEVVTRKVPNIQAALTTNGSVSFEGGGFQIIGSTTGMTTLVEPTYVSNSLLVVEGPPEEPELSIGGTQGKGDQEIVPPRSPIELGFTPGSLVAVYKEGGRIGELDYGVINRAGINTIELRSPGLMDFHYQGDSVFQFVPPVLGRIKVQEGDAERHLVPKEFSVAIPNPAMSKEIFGANLEQFSELANYYTNDTNVPKDEFDLPAPFMGLSYIDGTPAYNESNLLSGKGVLIIDTRSDNQGKPFGEVEISGDSKSPVEFSGILYVYGNLKINGVVNIGGAVVVDNASQGQVQIASNATGRIFYDESALRQTLLGIPFTTVPGTVMISSKPINLSGYVQTGTELASKLGAATTLVEETKEGEIKPLEAAKAPELPPEEALVETEKRPVVETIQVRPEDTKSPEQELIELF